MNFQYLNTPIGKLRLMSNSTGLTAIEFEHMYSDTADATQASDSILANCASQLTQYFAGAREEFDLPLAASGTQFQQNVWKALRNIPYGEVRSYRDIAESINHVAAVRAVGAANGRNPLPVVVPCHRVIGSDGSLTGFAGGIEMKSQLLQLEGVLLT
ncbi:MAG: methylated-DNA-[protein]-cysteine S-methyltransferase [Halioglobus sp.]|jgi:methylated-DNA-[protein]-cysteine S-methyltransferase